MPLMCLVLYFLTNKSIPIFHSFHHAQTKRLFVKVYIVTRKSLATFLRQKPLSSRSVILPKKLNFSCKCCLKHWRNCAAIKENFSSKINYLFQSLITKKITFIFSAILYWKSILLFVLPTNLIFWYILQ